MKNISRLTIIMMMGIATPMMGGYIPTETTFKASRKEYNVELRNKSSRPIYVMLAQELSAGALLPISQNTALEAPSSKRESDTPVIRAQLPLIQDPFYLVIANQDITLLQEVGDVFTEACKIFKITLNKNSKTVYITYEAKGSDNVIRPQKGTFGKTQSGLSLSANVKPTEITEIKNKADKKKILQAIKKAMIVFSTTPEMKLQQEETRRRQEEHDRREQRAAEDARKKAEAHKAAEEKRNADEARRQKAAEEKKLKDEEAKQKRIAEAEKQKAAKEKAEIVLKEQEAARAQEEQRRAQEEAKKQQETHIQEEERKNEVIARTKAEEQQAKVRKENQFARFNVSESALAMDLDQIHYYRSILHIQSGSSLSVHDIEKAYASTIRERAVIDNIIYAGIAAGKTVTNVVNALPTAMTDYIPDIVKLALTGATFAPIEMLKKLDLEKMAEYKKARKVLITYTKTEDELKRENKTLDGWENDYDKRELLLKNFTNVPEPTSWIDQAKSLFSHFTGLFTKSGIDEKSAETSIKNIINEAFEKQGTPSDQIFKAACAALGITQKEALEPTVPGTESKMKIAYRTRKEAIVQEEKSGKISKDDAKIKTIEIGQALALIIRKRNA